jgi:hypothetical protein
MTVPLLRLFDSSCPPVRAPDGTDDLGAGGEAFLDQPRCHSFCGGRVREGGRDLTATAHVTILGGNSLVILP